MPKQLIILSVVVLCLCAIGGSLVSFQTSAPPKSQREFTLLDSKTFSQLDWVAVLSQLPQYKKAVVKTELVNTPTAVIQISDGHIIGIVVDEPKSVLIYVDQSASLEPLQLTVGEGWLTNWEIKRINVDSVEWFNQSNQQSYKQMLFNNSHSEQ
jgi:hypothetical protein